MDNHPAAIAAAVYRWYTARGVQCRFAPDAPGELTRIGRPGTDMERQLLWLSRQVAPVVDRLRQCYSESDLYSVLFDGASPVGLLPLDRREDNDLRGYDDWSIKERKSAPPHRQR